LVLPLQSHPLKCTTKKIERAEPGDIVGFAVNIDKNLLKRGYVCGAVDDDPPMECESFIASIMILNHPNEIRVGYTPFVQCHTCSISCTFIQLIHTYVSKTGKIIDENPTSVKKNQGVLAILKPTKPMCIESQKEYSSLGRIIIRDMKQIIGVGIIKSVVKKT